MTIPKKSIIKINLTEDQKFRLKIAGLFVLTTAIELSYIQTAYTKGFYHGYAKAMNDTMRLAYKATCNK